MYNECNYLVFRHEVAPDGLKCYQNQSRTLNALHKFPCFPIKIISLLVPWFSLVLDSTTFTVELKLYENLQSLDNRKFLVVGKG